MKLTYCGENTNTCFSEREAMVLQAGSLLSRACPVDHPFMLRQAVNKLPARILHETSLVRFLKISLASSAGIVGYAEIRTQTMKHYHVRPSALLLSRCYNQLMGSHKVEHET